MRPAFAIALSTALFGACLAAAGCAATGHPVAPASLGSAPFARTLETDLLRPGPIVFRQELFAEWVGARGSFLDLDDPAAAAAGVGPGPETAHIYAYSLEHPRHGLYLIDTGVSAGLEQRVHPVMRYALRQLAPTVHQTTAQWMAQAGTPRGVFLTHLHFDHSGGLIDLPQDTPVFLGDGEARDQHWSNVLLGRPAGRILRGRAPLQEWRFQPDPSGAFVGVVDVFGDGSLWALHTPGHSTGSTAYLVRSTEGPRLVVGDAVHTRLGWEFDLPQPVPARARAAAADSAARLRRFAAAHPEVEIFLGHQPLAGQESSDE